MNNAHTAYTYAVPIMVILMILEYYFLSKKKVEIDNKEYFLNITTTFGMSLFDILVMGFIFSLYSSIVNYSIFTITMTTFTYFWAVFLVDFVFYLSHRCGHKFPFFWAIHGVHHQPECFNLSVSFRQPWFHKIYAIFFFLLLAFIGLPLEVLTVVYTYVVLSQFWVHTTFIKNEIPYFSYLFMTPTQHRVHHGKNPLYIDKNFGLGFSLWDHLLGTYQKETEPVEYGINKPFKYTNSLWVNVFPIIKFFNKNAKDIYDELEKTSSSFFIYTTIYIYFNYLLLFISTALLLTKPTDYFIKLIIVLLVLISFGLVGALADKKKLPLWIEITRFMFILLAIVKLI